MNNENEETAEHVRISKAAIGTNDDRSKPIPETAAAPEGVNGLERVAFEGVGMKEQHQTALRVMVAAMREVKVMPARHLYAAVVTLVDASGFRKIVDILLQSELVRLDGETIQWTGPMITGGAA